MASRTEIRLATADDDVVGSGLWRDSQLHQRTLPASREARQAQIIDKAVLVD